MINVRTFLTDRPELLSEAKQYFTDHMASQKHFVINPEEGIMAIIQVEPTNEVITSLNRQWMERRSDMFMKFWIEKVIPEMSQDVLTRFFNTMDGDLGEKFIPGLLSYLESIPTAEELELEAREAHREDVMESKLRAEYEEGSPEYDAIEAFNLFNNQ